MSFLFAIFLVISITELNNDIEFYKNYEHVNGLIKNVQDNDSNKIITRKGINYTTPSN